ncbi:uncharacterized protein [Amphiura filiformis]|uniref:uncharacterized protein n=1 Tax=Amphiura filiformis TaxID=82378 RepID=UPI003B21F38C
MDHRVAMLACLLALLPVIFAQGTEDPAATTQVPERCCFPASQFTISKSSSIGMVHQGARRFMGQVAILEEAHAAYDYNNSRIAALLTRRFINGYPEEHVQLIEDLEEGTVWVIYPDEETCTKESSADYPFRAERCISEYGEYWGTTYMDDKAVYTNTWGIVIPYLPENPTNGVFSFSVGPNCIPHGETFAGKTTAWGVRQQIVSSSGYYNYEEGIANPDKYFTVPDYCTEPVTEN